ncbi:hypothetical protein HZB07_02325 [Candidatus Saganbacteria bacterium]|nr:hypothetical protein [Candidatus Saganbacteria bacterium]
MKLQWKHFLSLLFLVFFALPVLAQQGSYPQLDISGFKKWEYKKASVEPSRNYFTSLTQLGGYYSIFSSGPLQERLQLRLIGQLSESLGVTYDLEQQPEIPDRYDVKVKQDNYDLTFGEFSASFSGNEFTTVSKNLNGVMLAAKDSWYNVMIVPSAKLKSQTQNLTTQKGNNTKGPYSLGHGSIVEGSERVELNNVLQKRNSDYTIDYFEGKITFTRIITTLDEFKYAYEFTNILDLFFPTLSKRDFFGLQTRFTINPDEFGRPEPKPEPVILAAREVFPSAGSREADLGEAEAAGQFQLKNYPLTNFSEKLTFMGAQLKKNEDYIIHYSSGGIKLLTRFLPTSSETLAVEYQYAKTSEESEVLAGIGSRGPYHLTNKNLVPESERIELDGKLLVRDLDYTIKNEISELMFGVVVGPTSQIKAKYLYRVYVVPPAAPVKFPKELKIGSTFLKESAKKGSTTAIATVNETISGATIIGNNYHAYLQNRPVAPTSESGATLIVRLNGVALTPEIDYSFPQTSIDPSTGFVLVSPEAQLAYLNNRTDPSNGYATGTIKFLNTTITATSQVTVIYTYYKSVVGRYSAVGNGTRGPYFLRNVRNIVPGSEIVQVWDQGSSVITTYTRNSSFDANAGATGYMTNYDANSPSITFNLELGPTKNFQIIYQYVPPNAFGGGDISQSVFGVDGSYKIGDVFKVETAYARSETDQVLITAATMESFTGRDVKNYPLHSTADIIEGSEKVSVNNRLLNRDIDYFISYTAPGQITFYYITPASADAITVEYKYQTSGGLISGQTTKADTAYKLAAETKLFSDKLVISGSTKQIGFDFTPQGGTSIGLGSRYKQYDVAFKPDSNNLSTTYSYKENVNPLNNSRTRFLRSYDNAASFGINPKGVLKVDGSYRNYRTMDDLSAAVAIHSNDTSLNTYTLGLTPLELKRGVLSLTTKYDYSATISQTDSERDSSNFSQTNNQYQHFNSGLKFTDRVSLAYDYQLSEPKTIAGTSEALSSQTRNQDYSYALSLDLTPARLEKWTARLSLLQQKAETLVRNFLPTEEVNTTNNQTIHMDLVPIKPLTSSLDLNRQERTSVLLNGANPRTDRAAASAQFTPVSWFSLGWNGLQSETIPETGAANRTTGNGKTYTASWSPINKEKIKFSSNFTLSNNNQTAPSGSYEGISTNTDNLAQNYTVTLAIIPAIPINLGLIREDYQNNNNHPLSVSQIDTQTQNQTINIGASYTPVPMLSFSGNLNNKTTTVIKDRRVAAGSNNKVIIDSKISYQPANWGTLVYTRQDEDNGGEVQGGQMVALNILKVTSTYSLNVTIPADSPVVSSFVVIASLKTVDYKNRSNASDDFVASLLSFEGSLNF